MFGYVTVNKDELKIKEWNYYHANYCGLCHSLKEVAGAKARLTVSYDMTFLTMLLDDLYDCEKVKGACRCIAHPVKKHGYVKGEASLYAAKMNLLLLLLRSTQCQSALNSWTNPEISLFPMRAMN